ncbi:MAG: hypothetical protein AUI47_05015 [Acidobacteria bacterium 13_1_40CM_2_68_5]|nr:MAG: hypothetical protein AUI47_05015 [Acidobacteria bacterium 13_1_40CM_2_68_5]
MTMALTAIVATAPAFAGPERAVTPVTVRSLAHDLAGAAAASGDPRTALELDGISLGRRPDAPLTEAAAVALLKSVGVGASTSNPGRALTQERADVLVTKFRAALASQSSSRNAAVGRHELPSDVDTCFQEQNHGACMACCKDLGGGASSCAKACMVINKPSPDEPLP